MPRLKTHARIVIKPDGATYRVYGPIPPWRFWLARAWGFLSGREVWS